jgi:GDP-L-fucose synthase
MTKYSLTGKRVWVCGHNGMVGAAITRRLKKENPSEIITVNRQELDLTNQSQVNLWVKNNKPDCAFIAAAKVGGIVANSTYPAQFLYENLMIAANTLHAAHLYNIEKVIFLGSSCIYPKLAAQPIIEDSLLTGPLEPSNQWYAIAKIAGLKLCESYRLQYGSDFISAMPTNLYGPGDNYHLQNSHVIPALLRKAHMAKESNAESFEIWGTGSARREFMHVDDCADALIYIMQNISQEQHINIGQGVDITIDDLSKLIIKTVGYRGFVTKNISRPDGTPRKIMDNTKLSSLGWKPQINLKKGLKDSYIWFCENQESFRQV